MRGIRFNFTELYISSNEKYLLTSVGSQNKQRQLLWTSLPESTYKNVFSFVTTKYFSVIQTTLTCYGVNLILNHLHLYQISQWR
jgi:hypothetical protein